MYGGQVAVSLPRKQPGTGTRQVKGSVVTPSLHPEVPVIQFVSLGDAAAAGANTGTTGLLEGMETKLRDGIKDSLATNKRDLDGMQGVRSALDVRRDFGGAQTVLETAGEMKGNHWLA